MTMCTMIMDDRESNVEVNYMKDSINLARLFPINPTPGTAKTTMTASSPSCSSNCTYTSTLLGLNPYHHHHDVDDDAADQRNRRDFNSGDQQSLLGSSRWNPTPEQLLALEEMYRRGSRTPTAQEIQQIAARLRRFGKIEGKNVFYWFQNHKARERQKRCHRRVLESNRCKLAVQLHDDDTITKSLNNKKESELRRAAAYQLEQIPPPSSSGHVEQGPFPMRAAVTAESRSRRGRSRANGWSQSDEWELLQQRNINQEKNATWQTKFSSLQRQGSLMGTPRSENHSNNNIGKHQIGGEEEEVHTLQLFPVCSEDCGGVNGVTKKDRRVPITTINTNFCPNQFFEFLPLKD